MTQYDKESFKAECNRRRDAGLLVTGNTYPIKEEIKSLGGFWDGNNKGWLMPDPKTADRIRAILYENNDQEPPASNETKPASTEDEIPF